MPDFRDITVLREIVSCRSLSKAARNLSLTTSGVSMSLQRLEDFLGTQLIARTTRRIEVTDDGYRFLQEAGEALDKFESAMELFREREEGPAGTVRISCLSAFAKSVIIPSLSTFRARYPGITIELTLSDELPDLVKDRLDLAICLGPTKDSAHFGRHLCDARMVLVASPEYLAGSGMPSSPSDLAEHMKIGVAAVDGPRRTWKLKRRFPAVSRGSASEDESEISPDGGYAVAGNHDTAVDLALAGLGIALADERLVADHVAKGRLREVLTGYDASLTEVDGAYLIYPSKKNLPSRVRAVIEFLLEITGPEAIAAPEPQAMLAQSNRANAVEAV